MNSSVTEPEDYPKKLSEDWEMIILSRGAEHTRQAEEQARKLIIEAIKKDIKIFKKAYSQSKPGSIRNELLLQNIERLENRLNELFDN